MSGNFLTAFLLFASAAAGLTAQSPLPAEPMRTPKSHIDALAAQVDERDIGLLIAGLNNAPIERIDAGLPAGQFIAYRGENDRGRYVVVINLKSPLLLDYTEVFPTGWSPDITGVTFEAVADSGRAGSDLKRRFDAAPDKTEFGLIMARAYELWVGREMAAYRSAVTWIRTHIALGSTRTEVEALLQSHDFTIASGPRLILHLNFATIGPVCGPGMDVTFAFDASERLTTISERPNGICFDSNGAMIPPRPMPTPVVRRSL